MTQPIQTAAFWDESADGYVASAEPFTSLYCEDAAALAEIEPGMTLLDVATGPGALALAAARRGAFVTAIDFSQAMVDRLTARIGDLPITALRMDGQALDFADGSFDRACSVFGVPLFPEWRRGLGELARVVRPGGRAVMAVADNGYGFGPNRLLADARQEVTGLPTPFEIEAWGVLADRDRLTDEMRAAGLVDVKLHERTHDFPLPVALLSADHPMIQRNPVLAGLPDDGRAEVIRVAEARAGRLVDGDIINLPGTARIAVATKP